MDDKEEQPTTPPSQSSPRLRPITIYSYQKAKRRKSQSSRSKRNEIREDSPEPNTELVSYENLGKSTRNKQKRSLVNDSNEKPKSKSSAMDRAEELLATLDDSRPKFAKVLVRSNVTVGFWMHLPMKFCKLHMPEHDAAINVETENGEYVINYISDRTALSGGWKAFCGSHKLQEGDVLVFQLLKPLSFKIYIIRGAHPTKENGKKADAIEHDNHSDGDAESQEKAESLDLSQYEEENEDKNLMIVDQMNLTTQTENNTEDHSPKTLDIVVPSESAIDFKDMESFETFHIIVNGLAIDSELSDHHRNKYYELCRSQKSFLHSNLLNSINNKLAAEIIIGTVNISEAIRASKLASSQPGFAVWDKTLKGFELLGMNVGFLRSKLDRLMNLAAESEEAVESECRQFRLEQARIDEETRSLELKLAELKEARKRLEDEIETLKLDAESQEKIFQEAVNAPW